MFSRQQSTIRQKQAIQAVQIVDMTSSLGDPIQDLPANWPSTSKFETIPKNIAASDLNDTVKESIKLGQQNQICCSCIGDCATNPKCECLLLAKKMAKKFNGDVMKKGVPVNLKTDTWKCQYWDKTGFVCGSKCSCYKSCSLRALEDIDKNHQKRFKIIRKDAKGFCLFTKKAIKKGAPVIPFNGEISTEIQIGSDAEQYSLQCFGMDEKRKKPDCITEILNFLPDLDKGYKESLEEAYKVSTYINPLKKGNCARMFSHSCDPNLEILRVFQQGISPADLRIVFVANKRIAANTELSFDYGPKYVAEHLKGQCLCDKCLRLKREQEQREKEEKAEEERKKAEMARRKRGIPISEKDEPLSKRTRLQVQIMQKISKKMGIANTAEFVG